jgi:hypothetical protein
MSLRISLLLSAVLLCTAVSGQNSGPAFIEGTVVNKITSAPVKHAHVIHTKVASANTEASSPISSDTDNDGHFSIPLEPGSYRLWVERAGFARQVYGSHSPRETEAC